jgi:hypothetical protein
MQHWGKKITTFFLIRLENLHRNKFKIPKFSITILYEFHPIDLLLQRIGDIEDKRNSDSGSDIVKMGEKRKTRVFIFAGTNI